MPRETERDWAGRMLRYFAMIVSAVLLASMTLRALADDVPTVFAAASLRDVLEEAALQYRSENDADVRLVFAASSVLARQIEAGAPADLFVSANEEWVTWLGEQGNTVPADTRTIAGNTLVVGYPPGSKPPQKLDGMLAAGRFAMGDPRHVPAGRYAVEALENLSIDDIVLPHAIYCENVRVALAYLRRGEVSAAILYGSDLTTAPELVKAYTFPAGSHAPIRYVAAPVVNGDRRANKFLEFLSGENGQALFAKHGFRVDR